MTELELKQWILDNLVIGHRFKKSVTHILNKNPEIFSLIIDVTEKINTQVPVVRCGAILAGITSHPRCLACNKELKESVRLYGSVDTQLTLQKTSYCSCKCAGNANSTKLKRKETCLDKYGVANVNQSDKVLEKTKKTNLKKYGTEWQVASKKTRTTIESNNLDKYGTKYSIAAPEVREVIQSSFDAKGGRSQVAKNSLDKMKATMQDRYGVDNINHVHLSADTIEKLKDTAWILDQNFNHKKSIRQIAIELGVTDRAILSRLQVLGIKCNDIKVTSFEEKQVQDFVKSLIPDEGVILNSRQIIKPKELDIYIPSRKLAIEYHGLYWHSEKNGKGKDLHAQKVNTCEELGIQLIQVFSNEWNFKQDIVKSIIRSKLNKLENTVFARKCEIREVSNKVSQNFLKANHLQGSKFSKVKLGLFFENELVSLMTFSNRQENYDWELDRFCNKLNTKVIGGASKLFKYFNSNYSGSILTYADRRYSTGELYNKLGFNFSHVSRPDFYYTKDYYTLESRMKYQKHHLSGILKSYDPSLSGRENMLNNGFDIIYGAGNLVYIYNN